LHREQAASPVRARRKSRTSPSSSGTQPAGGGRVAGGALAPEECAALARRAAALVDAAVLSRAQEDESVLLWEDEDSVAWLNVVPDPRDTGFHDHDGSAVGVHVIAGSVTNEGLPPGGMPLGQPVPVAEELVPQRALGVVLRHQASLRQDRRDVVDELLIRLRVSPSSPG
jgi:hypothetical protein